MGCPSGSVRRAADVSFSKKKKDAGAIPARLLRRASRSNSVVSNVQPSTFPPRKRRQGFQPLTGFYILLNYSTIQQSTIQQPTNQQPLALQKF